MTAPLPILNRDGALTRLLEDRILFCELLDMFQKMHACDMERLDVALHSGQTAEVSKILHGLRGAAVIIGAERLNGTAMVTLRAVKESTAPPLATLRTVFALTMSAVAQTLDELRRAN